MLSCANFLFGLGTMKFIPSPSPLLRRFFHEVNVYVADTWPYF